MPCRHQRGFSLAEVLVALLLLGLALSGALQLQLTALRHQRDTQQHARAHQLAADLAERVRGHATVAALPEPANNPFLLDVDLAATALPAPAVACVQPACAAPEAAQAEVANWLELVHAALPNARIQTCHDRGSPAPVGNPDWNCAPATTSSNALLLIKLGWGTAPAPPRMVLVASTGAHTP